MTLAEFHIELKRTNDLLERIAVAIERMSVGLGIPLIPEWPDPSVVNMRPSVVTSTLGRVRMPKAEREHGDRD